MRNDDPGVIFFPFSWSHYFYIIYLGGWSSNLLTISAGKCWLLALVQRLSVCVALWDCVCVPVRYVQCSCEELLQLVAVCQLASILNISTLIAQKITANDDCTWHRLTLRWHHNASCAPASTTTTTIRSSPPFPSLPDTLLRILCQPPLTGALPLVTAACPLLVEAVLSRDVPKFNLLWHRFLPPFICQPNRLWTIMLFSALDVWAVRHMCDSVCAAPFFFFFKGFLCKILVFSFGVMFA